MSGLPSGLLVHPQDLTVLLHQEHSPRVHEDQWNRSIFRVFMSEKWEQFKSDIWFRIAAVAVLLSAYVPHCPEILRLGWLDIDLPPAASPQRPLAMQCTS